MSKQVRGYFFLYLFADSLESKFIDVVHLEVSVRYEADCPEKGVFLHYGQSLIRPNSTNKRKKVKKFKKEGLQNGSKVGNK